MVRFGVVGTGFICDEFMEAAAQIPEFSLAAWYSRDRALGEQFACKYGAAAVYTDLEELASSELVDAVYIASPNSLHCGQSILMLKHGKHVLCEKPVSSNEEELNRMLDAAKANGAVLLEAMRPVFDPGFSMIESLLGRLGTVRRATFQYGKYSSRYDKFRQGQVLNAFNPALSNAAVMDIGVYCIHALVKLFGMPKDVQVQSIFLENGMEGAGTILADYGSMQAELIYSKITDNVLPSQIQGEEGTMVIREIPDTIEILLYPRNGQKEKYVIDKNPNNMVYEIQEFITLITEHRSACLHNRYSQMEMQMMDAVRRKGGIRFSKEDPLFCAQASD